MRSVTKHFVSLKQSIQSNTMHLSRILIYPMTHNTLKKNWGKCGDIRENMRRLNRPEMILCLKLYNELNSAPVKKYTYSLTQRSTYWAPAGREKSITQTSPHRNNHFCHFVDLCSFLLLLLLFLNPWLTKIILFCWNTLFLLKDIIPNATKLAFFPS